MRKNSHVGAVLSHAFTRLRLPNERYPESARRGNVPWDKAAYWPDEHDKNGLTLKISRHQSRENYLAP